MGRWRINVRDIGESIFYRGTTLILIVCALKGLKAIFQEGFNYKKAGVMLSKITPLAHVQPDLFGDVSLYDYYRKAKLMAVVDAINAIYGRDSLFFAV